MDLNSSPCNLPAAIACVSWYIAEVCSSIDAPPILNCLFICSTKAIVSSFEEKASFAKIPNLPTAPAISRYDPRVRSADAYTLSIISAVDCVPSLIKLMRDLINAYLSLSSAPAFTASFVAVATAVIPTAAPAMDRPFDIFSPNSASFLPRTSSAFWPTLSIACTAPAEVPLILTLICLSAIIRFHPLPIQSIHV